MRVVSLVPSLTELAATVGAGDDVVGVTRYCTVGAPASATMVGGTKDVDRAAVARAAPDLVLANTEENRAADLDALRRAGLTVHESYPRCVAAVPDMIRAVANALGRRTGGDAVAADVEAAIRAAAANPTLPDRAGPGPVRRALVLVWRRPWMAAGPDTYVADLLACCGLDVSVPVDAGRYPRVGPGDAALEALDLVVLPSEPYAFTAKDVPAVDELTGGAPTVLVDGRLLTWHGQRTAAALRTFSGLAARA